MKLLDKLFQKLGYIKAEKYNELRLQYELMQKYDIQLLRMEYDITPNDFKNIIFPNTHFDLLHEAKLKEFFKSIAPFIQRRAYRNYPIRTNQIDGARFELRLYVGKPKSDKHEVAPQS